MPAYTKTASKKFASVFFTYLAVCILLALTIFNLKLYFGANKDVSSQVLGEESDKLKEDKLFWQEFVSDNPTYQDGWIMLAKTNLALGYIEEAKAAFEKAKEINPNSEEISKLNNSF